ncbi:MAG: hypothetical protein COU11_00325 [Candidatus Harrisonbacteria bacterium CG10_big_fil_rev_8_21_14_0_10_49_15]|uniref:Divalent metal cation transporter n=1 Tax=Candidatus Harrisonbacteria bacterium CG10_big_fil_rev_8_21_14_0_10_49_15 TaxID=1974587 RepID=A0A2H0UM00_9BACT|nr:MAG: hypothetical protein COU11_00325 [Candidatus Harrisonbacteria bacterium CG10_big_fil_rev_8_21_14_0_10_49_15]
MLKDFETNKNYPDLEVKSLPRPVSWRKALGVGLVTLGLSIGTGELILWPHLTSKFGLGILWGALVGITLQYFINQEVARLALATGESFFTSSSRVFRYFPFLWLGGALLLYIWPGWAGAIGTTLTALFGFGNYIVWAWVSLALVLVITFSGRTAYKMLERALMFVIPLFFALLIFVSFLNLNNGHIVQVFKGLFNFGWLPEGIDLSVFLAAAVFAGAGGILNLCISLWYRDKQLGMASYVGRITNPISGRAETVATTGAIFETSPDQLRRWRGWMRYIRIDQGLIFWFLGLVTLILLSANAFVVLSPLGLVPEGTEVAVVQAEIFGQQWGLLGSRAFLVMTFLMLFSAMWAIIDAFVRIVSDILYVNSRIGSLQKWFAVLRNFSIHQLYYGLIVGLVIINAALIPLHQPLFFLVVSSVLGGVVMALYVPLLLYINNRRLPKPLRPGLVTNAMLVLASLFYGVFSVLLLIQKFFHT